MVRADLRALLQECPVADEVILCASELAANAALHSDSRLVGGTFTVRATVHHGCHCLRSREPAVNNILTAGRAPCGPGPGYPGLMIFIMVFSLVERLQTRP